MGRLEIWRVQKASGDSAVLGGMNEGSLNLFLLCVNDINILEF